MRADRLTSIVLVISALAFLLYAVGRILGVEGADSMAFSACYFMLWAVFIVVYSNRKG